MKDTSYALREENLNGRLLILKPPGIPVYPESRFGEKLAKNSNSMREFYEP
jgi:hypothetical protein